MKHLGVGILGGLSFAVVFLIMYVFFNESSIYGVSPIEFLKQRQELITIGFLIGFIIVFVLSKTEKKEKGG